MIFFVIHCVYLSPYDSSWIHDLVRFTVDYVEEHHGLADPVSIAIGNGSDVVDSNDATSDVRQKSLGEMARNDCDGYTRPRVIIMIKVFIINIPNED